MPPYYRTALSLIRPAVCPLLGPGPLHDPKLPHLAGLMERAAHGVLLSEEPTISPAIWATIATGMPRFEHGVVDFLEAGADIDPPAFLRDADQ